MGSTSVALSDAVQLSGLSRDLFLQFGLTLLDNCRLATNQLSYIYTLMSLIPPRLHHLQSISVADFLGTPPLSISLNGASYAVNTFGSRITGGPIENQFPADVSPGYTKIFCGATAHEVNHVVDACTVGWSSSSLLANRRSQLIRDAGSDNLNYLRSGGGDGFFVGAPQEFFASIANQWFTDAEKVFELARVRFQAGRTNPINQALFFAEVYSGGGQTTYFYSTDLDGNLSRREIPLRRDLQGRITGLQSSNVLFSFTLNERDNVTSLMTSFTTSPPTITSQPVSQSVNQGSPASFSVIATGPGLNFQWRLNSVPISGATNASYNLASVTINHAGTYTVIVTNEGGSVTSSNAVLTVIPPPRTGTGTATLFGLFVVGVTITDGGSGYTTTPLVRLIGGGGSGAHAVTVVSNGVVIAINLLDAGYGYASEPLVVIDPPFIPNPFLGIAPMSFLAFSNLTLGGFYHLQRSVAWYWSNQPISFTATNTLYTQMVPGVADSGDYRLALNPVPTQAFATPQMVNGFVVGATVTSGGSGYVTSPTINIVGGGGSNAAAIAHISGGVVTGINITAAGIGYTNPPTLRIAPPPAAAVAPAVQAVMRVDSTHLAPYANYQIQFKPTMAQAWGNSRDGIFSPTAVTNSQYLFITNGTGFFRLQHVP